jgi:hypothetical protein
MTILIFMLPSTGKNRTIKIFMTQLVNIKDE